MQLLRQILTATTSALILLPCASANPLQEWVEGIGARAGEKAAEKLVQGMENGTRNLAMATNQFGIIVADLYAGTPEQRTRARTILERLLDRKLAEGEKPKLDISVLLIGAQENQQLGVHFHFLANPEDSQMKGRFTDSVADWNAHLLNAVRVVPLVDEALRARVAKAAEPLIAAFGPQSTTADAIGCKFLPTKNVMEQRHERSQADQKKCVLEFLAPLYANLVMASLPVPDSRPLSPRYATDVPGGYFAALIARHDDIEALARNSPNARLHVWVHDAGNPDNALSTFRDLKGRVPHVITPSDWINPQLKEKRCQNTGYTSVGVLCWYWINMGLDRTREYVFANKAGK